MIKFFRKIRQKLLAEGKLTSYLLYAIGEIVLVVVGILIALQVNEWNGERKDESLRDVYIGSLIQESRENLQQFQFLDEAAEGDLASLKEWETEIQNADDPFLEVLNIGRNKFDGEIYGLNVVGTNTISVLISTGDLKLFPPDLRTELTKLKTSADNYSFMNKGMMEIYLTHLNRFLEYVPSGIEPVSFGDALEDEIWNSLNKEEVASRLRAAMNTKTQFHTVGTVLRGQLKEETETLTQSLEELQEQSN